MNVIKTTTLLLSILRKQLGGTDLSNINLSNHQRVLIDAAKSDSHINYGDLLKWLSDVIGCYMGDNSQDFINKGLARIVVYDAMSEHICTVANKITLAGWGSNTSAFGAIQPVITQDDYKKLETVEQYAMSRVENELSCLIEITKH